MILERSRKANTADTLRRIPLTGGAFSAQRRTTKSGIPAGIISPKVSTAGLGFGGLNASAGDMPQGAVQALIRRELVSFGCHGPLRHALAGV